MQFFLIHKWCWYSGPHKIWTPTKTTPKILHYREFANIKNYDKIILNSTNKNLIQISIFSYVTDLLKKLWNGFESQWPLFIIF